MASCNTLLPWWRHWTQWPQQWQGQSICCWWWCVERDGALSSLASKEVLPTLWAMYIADINRWQAKLSELVLPLKKCIFLFWKNQLPLLASWQLLNRYFAETLKERITYFLRNKLFRITFTITIVLQEIGKCVHVNIYSGKTLMIIESMYFKKLHVETNDILTGNIRARR